MKTLLNSLRCLFPALLVGLALGCAGNLIDKENVAMKAGFKVISPNKPEQQALLRSLPADKMTRVTRNGKVYYVLPDLKNNLAYVGGPKQYQAYLQLRQAQEQDSENAGPPPDRFHVVEVDSMSPAAWEAWDGWDETGAPGWY